MSIINEVQIKNWENLLKVFDVLGTHQDRYIWYLRGQADASWHLTPSLVRYFEGREIAAPKAHGIEFMAVHEFKSQAHLYVPNNVLSQSRSSIAWMMLMQHYSCPTRLLDWTQSPYVATYFAVEQHLDKDGAIWLFNSPLLNTIMEEKLGQLHFKEYQEVMFDYEYAISAIYPMMGTMHTDRSAAQQGAYTLCCSLVGNHEKIIAACFSEKYPKANGTADKLLNKIIISASLKEEFLSRLHTMNINARTLFPGADGLGRAASEIVRQRLWSKN